jgi:hypothetical protein
MKALEVAIAGIGIWSPEVSGWEAAHAALAADLAPAATVSRPPAELLPPAERRRAPEAVLVAVEVARQACAMARCDAAELPHVFASCYGDLAVNDYLCATLAHAPLELSPARFHHSVHNAAAGYWAIATGCRRSSSAISAGAATFGAGLLETALLSVDEDAAALMTAYDVAVVGPLGDVNPCHSVFGMALVLAPSSACAVTRLRLTPMAAAQSDAELAPEPALLHACHRDNPAAQGLRFLQALVRREAVLNLAAGPRLSLRVEFVS